MLISLLLVKSIAFSQTDTSKVEKCFPIPVVKQIMKDLPLEAVNVITEDNSSSQILYVGTDAGLYVSIDGGASSMVWNKGLPNSVPIHDIVIQARENEIVLGTHGRSIYISKLDDIHKQLQAKK